MRKSPPPGQSPSSSLPAPSHAADAPSHAVSRGSLSDPHSHSFEPSRGGVSNLGLAFQCTLGLASDFAVVILSRASESEPCGALSGVRYGIHGWRRSCWLVRLNPCKARLPLSQTSWLARQAPYCRSQQKVKVRLPALTVLPFFTEVFCKMVGWLRTFKMGASASYGGVAFTRQSVARKGGDLPKPF